MPKSREFAKFFIGGITGAFIGAGGVFYSFKSANTAENQYYQQLDFRRYQTKSDPDLSFEEKQTLLNELFKAHSSGYQSVFISNLEKDINEVTESIENIRLERIKSNEAAAKAREEEKKKAEALAKQRAKIEVRRNYYLFEDCKRTSTKTLCP